MKKNNWKLIGIVTFTFISIFLISNKYFFNTTKAENLQEKIIETTRLKTSLPLWSGNIFIPLATELGYMKEEGIEIEYVSYNNDLEVIEDLKNNKIDFAYGLVSDYFAAYLKDNKLNSKIVIVADYSSGADAIVMKDGAPEIASSKNKILSGYADYPFFIAYALKQLGASSSTFIYDDSAPTSEKQIDNFKNGKYDYIATYGPYIKMAVDAGGKVIFSSKERPDLVTDGIFFRNEYLNEDSDFINRFGRAYYRAYDFWLKNKPRAYEMVSKYMDLTPSQISEEVKNVEFLSYEDNLGAMTSQVGIKSIYGHLKLVQMLDPTLSQHRNDSIVNFVFAKHFK